MSVLSPDQFDTLMASFAPFEPSPILAIATSGGSDSLALALLAHQWAERLDGKALALTVDHRLRPESTAEAAQVKMWLEAHGIEHHTLTWVRAADAPPLESAIQITARRARYQLLGQWCQDHGVKHLLTAHQAQDQLETFMIRLSKGSGLKGLTGIQREVPTDFGRILRPLLAIDPKRLTETLDQWNQSFLVDPSNQNDRFARVRWRHLLPMLATEGLTPQTIQETLDRLNHTQRLIDQHLFPLIQQHVTLSPYGYAILSKDVLSESNEAFEEILKRVLATIGTRDYPVRRQALHRGMQILKSGKSLTLGGCQLICKPKEFWIVREEAQIGPDIGVDRPGAYLWDQRFKVEAAQSCRIAALGERGIRLMNSSFQDQRPKIPYLVLKTLPALWQDDHLLQAFPPLTFIPRQMWL